MTTASLDRVASMGWIKRYPGIKFRPPPVLQRSAQKQRASVSFSSSKSLENCLPLVQSSAMPMLVFYINRAGKNLDENQKRILEQAKDELRALYGKG